MTLKINRSELPKGFDAAVAAHAFERRQWQSHMQQVEKDKSKKAEDPTKHAPYPAPISHPLVMGAVNENEEADYEIVEDGPSSEEVLAKKKKDLIDRVSQAESDAINEISPFGKQRFLDLRETKIVTDENSQVQKAMQSQTWLDKIKSAISNVPLPQPTRNKEDDEFIKSRIARRKKIENIRLIAAKSHYEIEDLTSDNVDSWKMPTFTTS